MRSERQRKGACAPHIDDRGSGHQMGRCLFTQRSRRVTTSPDDRNPPRSPLGPPQTGREARRCCRPWSPTRCVQLHTPFPFGQTSTFFSLFFQTFTPKDTPQRGKQGEQCVTHLRRGLTLLVNLDVPSSSSSSSSPPVSCVGTINDAKKSSQEEFLFLFFVLCSEL